MHSVHCIIIQCTQYLYSKMFGSPILPPYARQHACLQGTWYDFGFYAPSTPIFCLLNSIYAELMAPDGAFVCLDFRYYAHMCDVNRSILLLCCPWGSPPLCTLCETPTSYERMSSWCLYINAHPSSPNERQQPSILRVLRVWRTVFVLGVISVSTHSLY
jgi:hypothetical protein